MKTVQHPGPVHPDRYEVVPCQGRIVECDLTAGHAFSDSVTDAVKREGFDTAWVGVSGAEVEELTYVIPAGSNDGRRVAWYSEEYKFDHGRIEHLGMIVGQKGGNLFIHGHGSWTDAQTNKTRMGHILSGQTTLSGATSATIVGITGAKFDVKADEETGFDLFHVIEPEERASGITSDFAALRVRANQDLGTALAAAGADLGWNFFCVYGVGSLYGARFEDGSVLDPQPCEMVLSGCPFGAPGQEPSIDIVGLDGTTIMSGPIARGENAVLITAELILVRV